MEHVNIKKFYSKTRKVILRELKAKLIPNNDITAISTEKTNDAIIIHHSISYSLSQLLCFLGQNVCKPTTL